MYQLGGYALFLSWNDLQIGGVRPVQDTARVLSRYVRDHDSHLFAGRGGGSGEEYGSIPVIIGLTDFAHPCQVLADLMTMREYIGDLAGKKACFIGDGNNMANSLIVGCLKLGNEFFALAFARGLSPRRSVLDFAKAYGEEFHLDRGSDGSRRGSGRHAHRRYGRAKWQEGEAQERKAAFAGYQVMARFLLLQTRAALCSTVCPRTAGRRSPKRCSRRMQMKSLTRAENRLHAQKAVLVTLMG
jgi:ornithine carbamoyltransferase